MKVDQTSPMVPRQGKTTGSMLKGKSGFVIPKNKLLGNMVPISRSSKKQGDSDAAKEKEETVKEVPRKTKWGSDLTDDEAVRKGRVLAYQNRVDQITQQLKTKNLEIEDDQESLMAIQDSDQGPSGSHLNHEKSELLENERRVAIGEIIKLNPSYKPPSDYKPLLKEAIVPIPVKENPGYNFLGLVFGPGGDTRKRLEKESGAKIQIYGTKRDGQEKVELTLSDEKENQSDHDELYVLVSADTYDKVDAAVSLIEILVNKVSEKSTSISIDDKSVLGQSNETITPHNAHTSAAIQEVVQSISAGPPQNPPQGQFQIQYNGQWVPTGPTHAPFNPPSGFNPSPISTSSMFNNPPIPSSCNSSTTPSQFGFRPALEASFGPIFQNPSLISPGAQQLVQVLQHLLMPHSRPYNSSARPNISVPLPYPVGQQPVRMGIVPGQPSPADRSTPWSVGQSSNTVQTAPPFFPPRGPNAPPFMAPPSNSSTGMVLPSISQVHIDQANRPTSRPVFSPGLPPQQGPIISFIPVSGPPFAAPKPPPNSDNFTFQPHRLQNQNSMLNVHNIASQPAPPMLQGPRFNNQVHPNAFSSSGPPSGPRSFGHSNQMISPRNTSPFQHNTAGPGIRSGNFSLPNDNSFFNGGGRPGFRPSEGRQFYGLSASTAAPRPSKQPGQDNDPEYDDLMASVGVK